MLAPRTVLRAAIVIGWLALALFVAVPALAQGPEGTPLGEQPQVQPQPAGQGGDPEDLDDVAVRLMPLLVGAALIERTLELVFTWVERALLDASHRLNRFTRWITGLVQVDVRHAWEDLNRLTNAFLRRQSSQQMPFVGDSDSDDPDDWPLAMLEAKLTEARNRLETAEAVIEKTIRSSEFVARKKMAAAWLSIIFGVGLALTANLRLFQPLGVEATGAVKGGFDTIDLLLAGILMGLGTEWVHQVIGLLIKGKGALGRSGMAIKSQADPEQIRALAEMAVQQVLDEQTRQLRDDLMDEMSGAGRPESPPT
jgi:hypothetical protein